MGRVNAAANDSSVISLPPALKRIIDISVKHDNQLEPGALYLQ